MVAILITSVKSVINKKPGFPGFLLAKLFSAPGLFFVFGISLAIIPITTGVWQ